MVKDWGPLDLGDCATGHSRGSVPHTKRNDAESVTKASYEKTEEKGSRLTICQTGKKKGATGKGSQKFERQRTCSEPKRARKQADPRRRG